MKRLCAITGSRADYGVLKPLLRLARESKIFEMQLIVAGMHLQLEYGETWREIEADGFAIAGAVAMQSVPAEALSRGVQGFFEQFAFHKPDLILVEGDRIEALAAALAAAYMGIPILHDGGGVLTRTIDNAARHAISHFASLHTVELPEARERLIRFGCDPATIHVVGALGIDAIRQMEWRSRAETLADLGLPADSRYLLVTFHPESEHPEMAGEWMHNVLMACLGTGLEVVATFPNSDPGSRDIILALEAHADGLRLCCSLGSTRYLHAMKYADAVVGNSSSGLLEAPSLKVPVVNVGHRQDGRPRMFNVQDCGYAYDEICRALDCDLQHVKQVMENFDANALAMGVQLVSNPYGDGHAAERIMAVLEEVRA